VRIAFALVATAAVLASSGDAVAASPPEPWYVTAPQVQFGVIRSLQPLGPGYELRFALYLRLVADRTGVDACIADFGCAPGTKGFPDDTLYEPLHVTLTYFVPATAPVTLVGSSVSTNPVATARTLYALAHGRNPAHLHLFAGAHDVLKEFAFYLEVSPAFPTQKTFHLESVERMAQVFHP